MSKTTNNSATNSVAQNNQKINTLEGKTMETTVKTTFADLLRAYEKEAQNQSTKAFTDTLQALATACTYSVLKKCINASDSKALRTIRRELAHGIAVLSAVDYAGGLDFITYDKNGDAVDNTEGDGVLSTSAADTIGDGLDLVNTAIVSLLEETEKQATRDGGLTAENWLELPYNVRQLSKKVWIKDNDSKNGFKTEETKPIREVYKAVRRAITDNSAVQVAGGVYTYIQDLARDADSDTESVIYRRLPKYADLGGYTKDFNGVETVYTVDSETVDDIETLIDSLNLTFAQKQIVELKLKGYGQKAIGTYLGISQQAVQARLKGIQKKARDNGLMPIE